MSRDTQHFFCLPRLIAGFLTARPAVVHADGPRVLGVESWGSKAVDGVTHGTRWRRQDGVRPDTRARTADKTKCHGAVQKSCKSVRMPFARAPRNFRVLFRICICMCARPSAPPPAFSRGGPVSSCDMCQPRARCAGHDTVCHTRSAETAFLSTLQVPFLVVVRSLPFLIFSASAR